MIGTVILNLFRKKNEDGSVKINDGAEPTATFPAKDLLKNIKPDAPTLALSEDKKSITITPNEVDTDAEKIIVTYKDKNNEDKTITAIKSLVNEKPQWKIEDNSEIKVNENGVITLPKDKVKGDTTVTATVTDKGGIAEGDKDPLTSEPGTLKVEETKADKVQSLGGLDPVALKKWVGDKVDWKDGVKAKDSATDKDKIKEYLDGATVTDASEPKTRTTENSGDFEGKVKVTFSDGSEIVVENQKLYVSDLVSPSDKENLPEDAIDVELKLGEGVKAGEVEGNKETPVTAKTYKVKPGTDLSKEKVSKTEKTCFEDVGATVKDDTYVDVVWNDKDKGTNFKATSDNNVFTATATKTYKVTVVPNGGTGTEIKDTKKTGETYKLPAKDTFTPPNDNQEFSGWKVGDDTNLKRPNETITITGDTVVKAIWKPIEFKATFQTEAGASGSMDERTVTKGSEFELPAPTFKPEKDKEFAGWKVSGQDGVKQAKDKIQITGDVTLTATWKDVEYKVTFNGTDGSGKMDEKTVKKGNEYELPENGFTAPKDKVFDGWMVGTEKKSVGDTIIVNGNTEVKAVWKANTTTPEPGTPGGGTKPGENPEKPNPSQPDNPTTPPTVTKNPDGTTSVTPSEGTGGIEISTTDENGKEDKVIVEKGNDGEWKVKEGDPNVKVNPKTGETIIPKGKTVDENKIIVHSKPKVKPEEPSYEENEIPGIKIRDHYTPTFPVYVTVPKTEKVEKAEEVPVSLETHKAYIAGYEDNTLRAEGNLTRAEAAAMVTRLAGLGLSDNSMPAFKDMQKNAWYFRYINAAVKAKMLDADNGIMRPNDKITRAEFAKMLAAIDKENSSVSKFDDIKGHRYEKEINKIYGNNRIEGYEDGSFRPDAYLTRAESAAFLNRMFNRIADKEAYAGLEDKLAKFKDFDASKWYYDEMVEATNSHELTRRGKASDKYGRVYEKWTRILPSDVK